MMAKGTLLLAIAAGCGPHPKGGQDTATADTASPHAHDLQTAADVPTYTLQEVARGDASDLLPGTTAFTDRVDGFTFFQIGDESGAWYLTNTYTHPSGDWCMDGTGPSCSGGSERTSGLISPAQPTTSMCLDDVNGRLFFVQRDKPVLEVADVAPEGEKAKTYLVIADMLRLAGAPFADWVDTGPCVWLEKDDALLLTDPTGGMVLVGATDAALHGTGTLSAAPTKIFSLEDGGRFVVDDAAAGTLSVVRTSDLSVVRSIDTGAPIVDWSVDPVSGRAWIAHEGDATAVDLGTAGSEPWTVTLPGVARYAEADPSTGLGLFLTQSGDTWTLSAVRGTEIAASADLDGTPVQIATPSVMGDLTMIVQSETGALTTEVYDPVPDRAAPVPPVYAFLLTTIESPFDDDIDMPCEGPDITSVEREINLIEDNANVLASLGIPIALAVTYNFATVAERCDRTDVFDFLEGLGFELGVMVHNKPGYNCVSPSTTGVDADVCDKDSPFACDPSSDTCTFPGDPDYCPLGDWDCYIAYMNAHNLVTDGAIPGGGKFVVGADRHNLWQWDWLRAYKEMARADGSNGFDVALFAHAWAYTDVVSLNDSRAKNPAPWRPQDAVEAWAPASAEQWDQDSAFSDLLYLPGLNSATLKISEWQRSGVFMEDFLNSSATYAYDAEDFTDLTQFLRASINYRTAYVPNTWYFHIHDLGLVNLTDEEGNDGVGATLLRDWVSTVPTAFAARGEIAWSTPETIWEEFSPR